LVYGFGLDSAIVQTYDSLGSGGDFGVMRDDDEGLSLYVQSVEDSQDFSATRGVKITSRFIGKDYYGVICECAGNSDPLLLASAELRGPMFEPVSKSYGYSQVFSVLGAGLLGKTLIKHRKLYIFNHV
jgi:hypothetical protein